MFKYLFLHKRFDQFARHSQQLITMTFTMQPKNRTRLVIQTALAKQSQALQQQYRDHAEQVTQSMLAFNRVKRTRLGWLRSFWCLPPTVACQCRLRLGRALSQAHQAYRQLSILTLQQGFTEPSRMHRKRRSRWQRHSNHSCSKRQASRFALSQLFAQQRQAPVVHDPRFNAITTPAARSRCQQR